MCHRLGITPGGLVAVAVAVGVGDTGTVGLAVADEVAIEDGVKDAVGVGVTVAEHNAKSVVGSVQRRRDRRHGKGGGVHFNNLVASSRWHEGLCMNDSLPLSPPPPPPPELVALSVEN